MNADMKWLDNPEVFRVNQLEAHSDHTYYESYEALEKKENALIQSLNGQWEFTFSKNILNPGSPHFAYFTRPDYFGMITADNQLVYNLDANTVQLDEGTAKGANLEKGKAFLQKLYDDLAKR